LLGKFCMSQDSAKVNKLSNLFYACRHRGNVIGIITKIRARQMRNCGLISGRARDFSAHESV
jgi:hypothetical protein